MVLLLQQNFTFSKGVKSAAAQQIGETRKKALSAATSFFRFDNFFFGLVKGEQPLTRCGESGVRGREGDSKHPLYLWARAKPARSAKPFDQKKKPVPRHQRENRLKEKISPTLWPARSASHLTKRKNQPRATSARTRLKKNKPYCNIALTPRHRRAENLRIQKDPQISPRET